MKKIIFSFILLVLVITFAVSKTPKSNSNAAENYFKELSLMTNSFEVGDVESRFLKVFKDFKQGANEKTIRATYADNFYFNDTFKVFHKIEDLIPYMLDTASKVKSTTVEILDSSFSGSDYYIRWVMVMEFKAARKNIYSRSIGMTQLRFNQEGKIIFHQDFWDSTEGFYQHLPYIGYFIRKLRSKL